MEDFRKEADNNAMSKRTLAHMNGSMIDWCNLYRNLPSSVPKVELKNMAMVFATFLGFIRVFSHNSEVYKAIVDRLKFLLALFGKCLSDFNSTSVYVWSATGEPLIIKCI